MPREQLHHLPNPVWIVPGKDDDLEPEEGRLFLYPTRAIRRKNIGEFLLWSALAENGDRFAVTLAPKNPIFKPVYENWVEFAATLGLPVEFDYAKKTNLPFYALLRRAAHRHRLPEAGRPGEPASYIYHGGLPETPV